MRFRSIFTALVLCAFVSAAQAHDYNVGSLHIDHPWSRAVPSGAKVAAGYMTIENKGTTPDRLIAVSSDIAGKAQIHEMTMEGGVMKMRPVEQGIEIAPGQTVKLAPNGYHIMLMDLKQPPKEGESFSGTLVFEKAGKVDIEYEVVDAQGTMDH